MRNGTSGDSEHKRATRKAGDLGDVHVLIPMLSIVLVLFLGWLKNTPKRVFDVLRDGQLCFYSTTILSALLLDIARQPHQSQPVFSLLLVMTLVTTCVYAFTISLDAEPEKLTSSRLGWSSIVIGAVTITLVLGTRFGLRLL